MMFDQLKCVNLAQLGESLVCKCRKLSPLVGELQNPKSHRLLA